MKFAFWRGAVRDEVFGEVFGRKFSGLFCWDMQSREKLQLKLQPKMPTALHSKIDKDLRGKTS